MTPIRTKSMSLSFAPALTTLFHNVWPVGLGVSIGEVTAEAAQWHSPWLAAIVTGAVVQIVIALMRAWFTERRDLMQTMTKLLDEQRTYWGDLVRNEKEERHQMANRAAKAEMKLFVLTHGVPASQIKEPPALYPEVEDQSNADRNQN